MSGLTPEMATNFAQAFAGLSQNMSLAILDKPAELRLALTTLFAGGHLLVEDAPGTGKTALARALAASIDGTNSRIQFTPDLLPSDITGNNIYNQKTDEWKFHKGPVFAEIVLADEINRASPKTQSALLEAMAENQVTVADNTYETPNPFMVIATQNPIEQAGTYPLPEAQLDRFLVKMKMGYPSRAAMIDVLAGSAHADRYAGLHAVMNAAQIVDLSEQVAANHIDPVVLDYIAALAQATRDDPATALGVSTRGAIGMARCARVWAASEARNYVIPDDIKQLAIPVWGHRVIIDPDAAFAGSNATAVIERALANTPVPLAGD